MIEPAQFLSLLEIARNHLFTKLNYVSPFDMSSLLQQPRGSGAFFQKKQKESCQTDLDAVDEVFPNEMVLLETPLLEVTAAEVDKVGMEARRF